LEFATPPKLAKRNPNTHAMHSTPPTSTKKNPIPLKTFQDYMHKIIKEDTSLEKEDSYSMKIIKPPPIVGREAPRNKRMKRKSFSTFNCMVEAIKPRNKMMVALANKMNTTNLEIVEWHARAQEKLSKLEINYLKSKNVEQIDYFKSINVEMNNTKKIMVQAIFGLL
jgi:hypothetical protein